MRAAAAADGWDLDPTIAFLNHGSFGACPRSVLDSQARWRARMERQLVQFFARDLEGLLNAARARLGAFVGADPDDLAFVPNATTGVNTVLANLALQPGDELLTTDHVYHACQCALDHLARRSGARVVTAHVPFPLQAADQVTEAVLAAATPRTRLALIDHVTSPTGLVFPIDVLVPALQARGIDVLVDGAHGPGMVPLDLDALGAAYYTGNLHKWVCAPKGSAFLHVRRDRQRDFHPLSISHGFDVPRDDRSRFQLEFGWGGTDDPTPWLCVPDALDALAALGGTGGLAAVMADNRHLALAARDLLGEALGIEPPAPDAMLGSLAAVPVPATLGPQPSTCQPGPDPLQTWLLEHHGIEVPVFTWPVGGGRVLRVSAQVYNDIGQYARLAHALRSLA
ncbi:MAG: aminotransferase class V-fold PLP-dependent enzyme [Myxococcales bacterium]|nr:aminotransferase class V-fold PLP-dependent enzyme [Myxococcales bacterium]